MTGVWYPLGMPDLKIRLSALMIEFKYTRSKNVLREMRMLYRYLEDLDELYLNDGFFRTDQ